MREFDGRAAPLEATAKAGSAFMHIIARSVDESDDEAIATAGIDPGPDDMVVLLTRFGGGPVEDRIIGGRKTLASGI